MSKSLKIICIIINNIHIAELINTVKIMISKQKQQAAALMKANMYVTVLQFEVMIAATEFFSVHEILICLTREIIIRCLNVILKDHAQSIT